MEIERMGEIGKMKVKVRKRKQRYWEGRIDARKRDSERSEMKRKEKSAF